MDAFHEEDYEFQAFGLKTRVICDEMLLCHNNSIDKLTAPSVDNNEDIASLYRSKIMEYVSQLKENYKQTALETFKEFKFKVPIEKLFKIPKNVVLDFDEPCMLFENKVEDLNAEVVELERSIVQMKVYEKRLSKQLQDLKNMEGVNLIVKELVKKTQYLLKTEENINDIINS